MIERDGIIGYPDASGRMYIAGAADHVLVFSADGSFLTRVGRRGEGPGELLDIASLSVLEDGVFQVFDRDRSVIMKFDWTGSLLHEVRTRGWTPWSTGTVPLDGNVAIHARHIRTPERVGYPLHSVDVESGEIIASFGSQTGRYDPLRDRLLDVMIARGPGESIWMGRKHAYWIELWEIDNRLTLSIRRDLKWFPEATTDVIGRGHGSDVEPEPMLLALAADDSLLWVLIHIADDRWRDASKHDDHVRYDSFVEVIDWKRGQVIGSQRFDEVYYPWAEPGVAGQSIVTPEGSVLYRVVRFTLEAASEPD
jgi:hypothetical protein